MYNPHPSKQAMANNCYDIKIDSLEHGLGLDHWEANEKKSPLHRVPTFCPHKKMKALPKLGDTVYAYVGNEWLEGVIESFFIESWFVGCKVKISGKMDSAHCFGIEMKPRNGVNEVD